MGRAQSSEGRGIHEVGAFVPHLLYARSPEHAACGDTFHCQHRYMGPVLSSSCRCRQDQGGWSNLPPVSLQNGGDRVALRRQAPGSDPHAACPGGVRDGDSLPRVDQTAERKESRPDRVTDLSVGRRGSRAALWTRTGHGVPSRVFPTN